MSAHVDDPDAYWLTSHQAADLLGVSRQRLGQLGDKGFVPYVRHRDGVRLYRREQMLPIANAREARWARVAGGTLSGGLAAGV